MSQGKGGFLKYHDMSTQKLVAEHKTKLVRSARHNRVERSAVACVQQGECHVMRQNRNNAIICCGHANGALARCFRTGTQMTVVRRQCDNVDTEYDKAHRQNSVPQWCNLASELQFELDCVVC